MRLARLRARQAASLVLRSAAAPRVVLPLLLFPGASAFAPAGAPVCWQARASSTGVVAAACSRAALGVVCRRAASSGRHAAPARMSGDMAAGGPAAEERRAADGSLMSEIIFMGTGSSSGNPNLRCVMDPAAACPVCTDAMVGNPRGARARLVSSALARAPRRADAAARRARRPAASPRTAAATPLSSSATGAQGSRPMC